jgi:hypothetical protein
MIRVRSSAIFGLLCTALCAACSSSATPASSTQPVANGGGDTDAGGLDACTDEPNVDTYAPSLKKLGQSGALTFELVSSTPAPPALNDNTFVVRVTGSDGTPLGGLLTAALDMPEHGHSSPKVPVITFDAAAGTFTLDPMYLFMVGLWRITLTFQPAPDAGVSGAAGAAGAEGVSDSAVFQFCID